MKIIELQADNIKRLRAVQITPRGNVVQITGANGQGKSSVLDAIMFALGGANSLDAMPVRKGEQKARIRLDLGEIIVTRKWSPRGTEVLVESAEGARFPSPQTMLDQLLGAYTFDPLAFTRQTPKQQADTIRALVPLDVDVDALDARARECFEQRTRINRDLKSWTERVMQLSAAVAATMDVEPIDTAALLDQMEHASEHNTRIAQEQNFRQREQLKADDYRDRAATLRARIAQLEVEAASYEDAASEWERATKDPVAQEIDVSAVRIALEAAQVENATREQQRVARASHRQAVDQLTAAKLQSENLTDEITACETQKADAIARAAMPVEGLAFDADGVSYRGIPLEQCSSAEQIRVSVAIAMAANPKLRVLRIMDGSLLDEKSLAIIGGMAEANDYQVWIERVESSGSVGVVIEDGSVIAVDGEPVAVPDESFAGSAP